MAPTDRIIESFIPALLLPLPYGIVQPYKCIFKTTMKWGFKIYHASQFSMPVGDMRQRAAYSAITICQLLAFFVESGNQRYIHTPQTQQAKEQVKTECTQTQECEK